MRAAKQELAMGTVELLFQDVAISRHCDGTRMVEAWAQALGYVNCRLLTFAGDAARRRFVAPSLLSIAETGVLFPRAYARRL